MSKKFELVNFYKKMPKDMKLEALNPNYHIHKLNVPFRMIICGASGSGKTLTALNLINAFQNTFYKIIIITKNKDEPLYNYLKSKLKDDVVICEGINEIPELDSFDKEFPTLIIFDDLVLDDQKKIAQYYIRARKLNVSCMFLSQSYFMIDKLIRQNVNYIIFKKISGLRDLKLICSDFCLGKSIDDVVKYYKECVAGDITNFLLIDIDKTTFRKNFEELP
jgi:hypothetical protein